MRNWLITVGLATLLPLGTAVAQDDPNMGGTPEATPEATPETPKETKKEGKANRRQERRMRRGMIDVDKLTKQLGLSEDQAAKMSAVNDELRERMMEMRRQFQEGNFTPGENPWQGIRSEFEGKVDAILTPEQSEKMKKIRSKQRERMRGRFGGGQRNREELGKRLHEEALKALALDEEAAALVTPRLESVLETRKLILSETERRRDAFRKKIREASDPVAIEALLKDYREAQKADTEHLKAAQAQLRELLTLPQEAKLVALNILD